MPSLGPTPGPFSGVLTERLYMSNFTGTDDAITVFVNSDTGNDTNSGSEFSPFLTLERAIQEIPVLAATAQIVIKLSGSLPFEPAEGFTIPAVIKTAEVLKVTDPDGFTARGPVRFVADPILVQTVAVANVVAQNFPDVSGLLTMVTNLALVPNALQGLFAVDDNGVLCQVASNTVTDINFCVFGALTAPIRILNYGAVIRQAVPGLFPTIRVSGSTAPIIFQGLNIQGGGFGLIPSIEVDGGAGVVCQACSLEGLWVGVNIEAISGHSAADCEGTRLDSAIGPGSGIAVFSACFFDKPDWVFATPQCIFSANQCVFNTPDNGIVFDVAFFGSSPGFVELVNIKVLGGAAQGVFIGGAGGFRVSEAFLDSNVGFACHFDGQVSGQAKSIRGQNNGGGMSARNGAQVETNGITDVNTGDGSELVVGSIAADLWVNFHAVQNSFDVTAVTGELARVWEV